MKIPRILWVIGLLLFLATALNYGDRMVLSIVSVDVRKEFHLSVQDYSQIAALFMVAYAIMYAASGWIIDRLGTKRGFALFIFGWSFAQALHAFAFGKWSLAGYRFMLGLFEPGNWPAAAKAVAEWFPPAHRALGIGVFNAGSSIGPVIAPYGVAWITIHYGWRTAFAATGALGLAWLAAWIILYDPPQRNRWITESEYAVLKPRLPPPVEACPNEERIDVVRVFLTRGCWSLLIARFFTDPVMYFVIFWLPEYLRNERHFDLEMVGKYAWAPFIFGGIGYILGGWLSAFFIRRGWPLPRARKFVMAMGAACLPVAIFAPFVSAAWMAIAATCFITFGHAFWVSNLQALPTDLFRGREVATASGFTGMGGAIGGALAQLGTGYLVLHFSYAPVFIIAGLMHPLSAALVYIWLPDREFAPGQ
uniref:D-galactonate transporter n=1 Tax=uncultured bacterium CSLF43 TaxID=1091575 RepID=G4WW05_9BACT|nr:d-galactonate transporter [uncultured bacterium CSLF43]